MARRVDLITLAFAAADAEKVSAAISNNKGVHQGQLVGWKVTAPAFTDNPTYTVKIKDSDGDIIYTSAGGHADGGTLVVMGLNIPLVEKEQVVITLSAPPGLGGGNVTIRLYYNPDAMIP